MSNAPATQRTYYDGSALELPTLPCPSATQPALGFRKKSRSRLRSLSNASKKIVAFLRSPRHATSPQEQAPPVPPIPSQYRTTEYNNSYLAPPPPPPPYSELPLLAVPHSRASSSSSSSTSTSRRPLRERCNFHLTVATSAPTTEAAETERDAFITDLNTQLRTLASLRSQGPRVSLLSPVHVSLPGRGSELTHLHEILPYLSVAFCDSRSSVPSKRFTHIIKIIYLGDEDLVHPGHQWSPGHAHHSIDTTNNSQTLTLAVPRPTDDSASGARRGRTLKRTALGRGGKGTRLSQDQLIYARDFLSLALPYYSEAHPEAAFRRGMEEAETRSADRVRVLICAPRGLSLEHEDDSSDEEYDGFEKKGARRERMIIDEEASATDIVSLTSCYLAYATGMPVRDMLKHFDEDRSVPEVWKSALPSVTVHDDAQAFGFRDLGYVEEVARMGDVVFPCRD